MAIEWVTLIVRIAARFHWKLDTFLRQNTAGDPKRDPAHRSTFPEACLMRIMLGIEESSYIKNRKFGPWRANMSQGGWSRDYSCLLCQTESDRAGPCVSIGCRMVSCSRSENLDLWIWWKWSIPLVFHYCDNLRIVFLFRYAAAVHFRFGWS